MEDNNFEQQFKHSVNAAVSKSADSTSGEAAPHFHSAKKSGSRKLPWIALIIVSAIILIESIILIITLINYFNIVNREYVGWSPEEYNADNMTPDEDTADDNFIYDDDYYLIAANLLCVSGDGSTIVLDTSNNFKHYDNNSALIDSGSYSIKDDSLISISSSGSDNGKVLYYYNSIADGLTIYNCEENNTEAE